MLEWAHQPPQELYRPAGRRVYRYRPEGWRLTASAVLLPAVMASRSGMGCEAHGLVVWQVADDSRRCDLKRSCPRGRAGPCLPAWLSGSPCTRYRLAAARSLGRQGLLKCPALALRPGQGPSSQGHSASEAGGYPQVLPVLAAGRHDKFCKVPYGPLIGKKARWLCQRGLRRPQGLPDRVFYCAAQGGAQCAIDARPGSARPALHPPKVAPPPAFQGGGVRPVRPRKAGSRDHRRPVANGGGAMAPLGNVQEAVKGSVGPGSAPAAPHLAEGVGAVIYLG